MYVQGPKKWLAKHIKEGGPSRIVKEQQEGTSPPHVRAIFSSSVQWNISHWVFFGRSLSPLFTKSWHGWIFPQGHKLNVAGTRWASYHQQTISPPNVYLAQWPTVHVGKCLWHSYTRSHWRTHMYSVRSIQMVLARGYIV